MMEKIRIWNVRGELRMRNWFQIQVELRYVWQSAVWAEWRERLSCIVPFPASEGTSVFPLCCSWLPQPGLEGRAGEDRGLFSPRLDISNSPDSNQSQVHESLLLLNNILSVPVSAKISEVWFWLLQLPDGPMTQCFDFTQPITVPSHSLLHCGFASHLCCSLSWGEGAFQIIMRMTLVVNEAVLVARNTREWVAQQYVCFLRLFSAALV